MNLNLRSPISSRKGISRIPRSNTNKHKEGHAIFIVFMPRQLCSMMVCSDFDSNLNLVLQCAREICNCCKFVSLERSIGTFPSGQGISSTYSLVILLLNCSYTVLSFRVAHLLAQNIVIWLLKYKDKSLSFVQTLHHYEAVF